MPPHNETDIDAVINDLLSSRSNFTTAVPEAHLAQHLIDHILAALFPHFSTPKNPGREYLASQLSKIAAVLQQLCQPVLDSSSHTSTLIDEFLAALPTLQTMLIEDAQAILKGDPAAQNIDEVILAYPGFLAIAIYRFAHWLHLRKLPTIPRIMTEHAHRITGIDIHPGAAIGRSFAIDHGTGVVIGETTIIQDHVKMYQGVTLGALSVDKSMASQKRHPTIEEGVIIYAHATILGGNTVIGAGSIIGGNVWITQSVPPRSKIYG